MQRHIFLGQRRHDFTDRFLADVCQCVGVHGYPGLGLGGNAFQQPWPSTIALFQNLLVRHRRHPTIVEFEPLGTPTWFNQSIVMSVVEVTGMYEYTMEFVLPRFRPVGRLVEEFFKVDFEGEFKAIIDL